LFKIYWFNHCIFKCPKSENDSVPGEKQMNKYHLCNNFRN
jgi:hypothetical protein